MSDMTPKIGDIQIVGGERDGQYVKWFGNTVRIQGVRHFLYRVVFTEGTTREYYVKEGAESLIGDTADVVRIEVIG